MKKRMLFLCVLLLCAALCGCTAPGQPPEKATAAEETAIPEKTAAPEESTQKPAAQWLEGKVRINGLGVEWKKLAEGDILTVTGENGDYYISELDGIGIYVEKRVIRLATEHDSDGSEAFTRQDSCVYDNVDFDGAAVQKLNLNTKVKVQCSKADWAYITWNGGKGYVAAANLSTVKLDETAPSAELTVKSYPCFGSGTSPLQPVRGYALAAGVPCYIAYLNRGDRVEYMSLGADSCGVLIGGNIGMVPRMFIRASDEPEYEKWNAYAAKDSVLCRDYTLRGEFTVLEENTLLQILDEFNGVYLAERDGEYGFIPAGSVAPAPSESGTSGYHGSYTAPETPADEEEIWTEPQL